MTPIVITERNFLDRYELTESTNAILTGLIALCSRESRLELNKNLPDMERVVQLTALKDEVIAVNNKTENFKSLDRMEEIIAHYNPILLAEKKKIRF